MKTERLKFKTPDETEAVYYQAFMRCDLEVMAALWADGDVVCVHPGSGAIAGRQAVTRSWAHIFGDAQPPSIRYQVIKRIMSGNLAVHLVQEEIATGDETSAAVLATNVYQQRDGGWLMVQHHASLVRSGREARRLQ